MQSFDTGVIKFSPGISQRSQINRNFGQEVFMALKRYCLQDWGDCPGTDKAANRLALQYSNPVFATYETSQGRICLLTEADRSKTIIQLVEECA